MAKHSDLLTVPIVVDLHKEIAKSQLWHDIHRAALTNPGLKDALERVIIIYELSKK